MDSAIDWAVVGAANIDRTFGEGYVELSFKSGAGSIAAGGQSGDIQLRMFKTDWSNFDEAMTTPMIQPKHRIRTGTKSHFIKAAVLYGESNLNKTRIEVAG